MDKEENEIIGKSPAEFLRFFTRFVRMDEHFTHLFVDGEAEDVRRIILAAMLAVELAAELLPDEDKAQVIVLAENVVLDGLKKHTINARCAFQCR